MKQELIDALKQLGRGRIDAAEVIAELLMPEPETFRIEHRGEASYAVPVVSEPPKKKAK